MVGGSGWGERGHLLSVFLFALLLEERRERVEREVAAPDQPLIVLFDQEAGGEPDQGGVVGEDADDVGAAAEHLRDRVLQAFVRVGDDELHAGEAALDQRAEEVPPERFGLALAAVKADHLASTRLVDAVRDHQTLPDDPAAIADLLHLRVQPQVRVTALQRPRPERFDLLVEASADAGDLRARDPQPQRLDQLIDLPRRHAADVRLLDHRYQRLLGSPARLQERGEVAAAADLRDRQLELAGARVPAPGPVAVAVRQAFLAPRAALGTDQLGDLRLHQLLHNPTQRLAQEVDALLLEQVTDDLLSRHPLRLGHRGDSSRRRLGGLDESERRGGRTIYPAPSDALLHHAMGRDRRKPFWGSN